MRIERIELFLVKMPLIYPWRTAYGSDATVDGVFVKLCSAGLEGWGESTPFSAPCYSPEYAVGMFRVLKDWMAPRLVGSVITSGDELQARLRLFRGNYFAKGALDMAWWDLYAQSKGLPLYRILGGTDPTIRVGSDFGIRDSIDELIELIRETERAGAPRVKLKFAPGWDLPVIRRVRETFPSLTLHIDCNGAYQLDDLPLFRDLDSLGLTMIEQPLAFDDLHDHAQLQRSIVTPVCLDESLISLRKAQQAVNLDSCRWANIKPGRVGGLTEALKIHDFLAKASVPCWVGGMLESAVGARHCAALATLENFVYPADVFPFDKFYAEDLSAPPLKFSTPWHFQLSEAPGVGAQPDPKKLAKCTADSSVIRV